MPKTYTETQAKSLATKAAEAAVSEYKKANPSMSLVPLEADPKFYLPPSSEGHEGGTYAVTFKSLTTTYKRMGRGKVTAHIQGLLNSGNEPGDVTFEAKEK